MASVPSTLFENAYAGVNGGGLAARLLGIARRFANNPRPATVMDRKTAADVAFYDRFYG